MNYDEIMKSRRERQERFSRGEFDRVNFHGDHDQSTHNPHHGGGNGSEKTRVGKLSDDTIEEIQRLHHDVRPHAKRLVSVAYRNDRGLFDQLVKYHNFPKKLAENIWAEISRGRIE